MCLVLLQLDMPCSVDIPGRSGGGLGGVEVEKLQSEHSRWYLPGSLLPLIARPLFTPLKEPRWQNSGLLSKQQEQSRFLLHMCCCRFPKPVLLQCMSRAVGIGDWAIVGGEHSGAGSEFA